MTLRDSVRALREITNHPLNAHNRARATIDYLKWNVGRRLLKADYLLPLANQAKIIVSNEQNFATLAYTCSLWDFEEMSFLLHLLRPGDLFLDVGANVGCYSILASGVAGARSLAFEPVPGTYYQLLRNIAMNRIDSLVRCLPIGIGDAEQKALMTADRGGLNHIISGQWKGATTEVVVRPIDAAIGDESCRLMKIDTEGFELNVLRGGPRTLSDPHLIAVIIELNESGNRYGNSDEAVHSEIRRYGFAPYKYDPRTRALTLIQGIDRSKLNTLYIRDLPSAARMVADAPKFLVRDEEI